MAAYRRVYDSSPAAKNRDQLRNPTLLNRVWATEGTGTVPIVSAHFRSLCQIFEACTAYVRQLRRRMSLCFHEERHALQLCAESPS